MTRIKICGLFRDEDIAAVNEAQPDYVGFVFAPSRRQVSADLAMRLSRQLSSAITPAGVFVNPDPGQVAELCQAGIIRMAQLHGQESETDIQRLKNSCAIPVIKAIRMDAPVDLAAWQSSSADYLLLDQGSGGTGQSFDWRQIPALTRPYFLAGGIDAENLAAALALAPYAIDVSSGVETAGFKDGAKILQMVQLVRQGSQSSTA